METLDLEKELAAAEAGGDVDVSISPAELQAVQAEIRRRYVAQFHMLKENALANRACGEEDTAQNNFAEAKKVLAAIKHLDERMKS